MGDAKEQLVLLRFEMERIRIKLHEALDAAGGKHLDESVQEVSRQFDRVFSAYMHLVTSRREECPPPPPPGDDDP